MIELARALEASALGVWARETAFAYPAANLAHLLGLVLLVGAIGFLDLRLAGAFRRLPVQPLAAAAVPLGLTGLGLFAASGLIMFSADAAPLAAQPLFRLKLVLIAAGLAHAALFHLLFRRRLAGWDGAPPLAGRIMAVSSLALWLCVAALGRLVAYV